jgi:hypothetical protein
MHYHTGSAGMTHRGGHSPVETADSIIGLRLDECTWRIVNDRTHRRDNVVHPKRHGKHMSEETAITPPGDR